MIRYSKKITEYYEHPLHAGRLDDACVDVGTGIAGVPALGNVVRIQIQVDAEKEMITKSSFKAYGCGVAIACASFAADWLQGKTLRDAYLLNSEAIAKEMELPPLKIHCSLLTEEAVKEALENYIQKKSTFGRVHDKK